MHSRAPSLVFLLTAMAVVPGCGNSHRVCAPSAACPVGLSLVYATTSSNQILGFSINSSGALTALPTTTGPANSQSVSFQGNNVVFADQSTNAVDSFEVDMVNGTLTAIEGSPFSLGAPDGGPNGIAVGSQGYLYATEPNGTIVGFGNNSEIGSFGLALPGSPYPAGVAPAGIASASSLAGGSFLYASDPGDATGGILAYSFSSTGSLTPVNGSPFPTLSGSDPLFVFQASYTATGQGLQGQFLLVSLTKAAKVAAFVVDSDGSLTAVPGSPFSVGNGPATIAEDLQNHIFVLNGADHTVSALNLASNGVLTPIGSPVPVGTATGGMTLSPGELFIADTAGSEIWALNVDHATGSLTQAGAPLPVSSPPLQVTFAGSLYPP
jgi:6-phosphogluconolactonase (cycloisomerase 2 family)